MNTSQSVSRWIAAWSLGAVVATAHCVGPGQTGRFPISFPVTVQGIGAESVNTRGWHVRIERAVLVLGPVQWLEGEPLFGALETSWSFGVAMAHPGHYVPGEALADVPARFAVDLMVPEGVGLPLANGVSGQSNSASVNIGGTGAVMGPSASVLEGHAVMVSGVADRNGVTVRFYGYLDLDTKVDGMPARQNLVGQLGSWRLQIDLSKWFIAADFSTLSNPDPDGRYALVGENSVTNGWFRGVTDVGAYQFQWLGTDRDQ